MKIQVEETPQIVKVSMGSSDVLDHTNAMLAREGVVAAVKPSCRLILDFGTVRSIDSAGVGALVAILKAVRRAGGRMVLIGVHPQVLSVLKTIRLTTVFEICSDEAGARAALESTSAPAR